MAMLDGLIDCIKECKSLCDLHSFSTRRFNQISSYMRTTSIHLGDRFLLALTLQSKTSARDPWGLRERLLHERLGRSGCSMVSNIPLYTTLNHFSDCYLGHFHSLQRIRKEQRPATCQSLTSGTMPIQKNWLFIEMRSFI